MPLFLNLFYLLGLTLLSPWLIYRMITTGKYRRGFGAKFLGLAPRNKASSPTIWFHGVSVGEILSLRVVIRAFRQRHPNWKCIISTTTDTGLKEAQKNFADLDVFYYPFDFSWSVRRALKRANPDLIVLAESELWPNFLLLAKSLNIPVALINARMSPRSVKVHRRLAWLSRMLWPCIEQFAVQTRDYADNFAQLGISEEKLHVTASVKYDGALTNRWDPALRPLREFFNVKDDEVIWIAGSTQAPEEEIVLNLYPGLKQAYPNLRLIIVPRQRERFDEVARLLKKSGLPFVRRSEMEAPLENAEETIVLVDTIGELGQLWSIADIAFVGGSMDGKRGGQNVIEPAGFGSAVIFGPHVWNFREPTRRLLEADGAVQIQDEKELLLAIQVLLRDPRRRQEMGTRAQKLVIAQQGATQRTLDVLDLVIEKREDALTQAA